jgi:hypothetical protein
MSVNSISTSEHFYQPTACAMQPDTRGSRRHAKHVADLLLRRPLERQQKNGAINRRNASQGFEHAGPSHALLGGGFAIGCWRRRVFERHGWSAASLGPSAGWGSQ